MAEPKETLVREGERAVGSEAASRRLPVGRHALPREFVVRSQRDRMLDAMAQVCAAGGYGAATVEAVTARAGVSRRTFYDQFKDRDECFLAAYDAILAQFLERVLAAYGQAELDWAKRVRSAIGAMLSFLASEPAFARMCIVEVLAAGECALERYDAAVGALAGLLDNGRARMPDGDELPGGIAADMVEGGAFLIREQILAGRTDQLESLLPDLTYATLVPYLGPDHALRQAGGNWSAASAQIKRVAQGGRGGALQRPLSPPADPPLAAPHRQRRWREQARRSRRERMLDAMIDTVSERGYHQTSMNDVAARAGVGRDTLRQQFGDKQGMFIAAHDWLAERLADYVAPAYQQPGSWPEQISRALSALLTAIAYRPQGARVAIIEVLAAGPEAHRRHLAAIETFAGFIDRGRDETPDGHRLPPTLARVVAGAAAARIHKEIATGHGGQLPGLHPQLLYLVLLPYLGHQQAQQHAHAPHAG
jgi:AcrR family transcriptional regulator